MTAVYNDARYTYDQANLTYDGLVLTPALSGTQPNATGAVALGPSGFHRALAGNQPVVYGGIYDDPQVTYEQSGIPYDSVLSSGGGGLSWHGTYHRLITGSEPFPTGVAPWIWHPYTWAEYTWSISSIPESTVYAMSVTDDDQVQYEHTQAHDDARTEAEYSHSPLRPHTKD